MNAKSNTNPTTEFGKTMETELRPVQTPFPIKYHPTVGVDDKNNYTFHHCITACQGFEDKSFEELKYEYVKNTKNFKGKKCF